MTIEITATSEFLGQQRAKKEDQTQLFYTFSYEVTITNQSGNPVQLLDRHWLITDADNKLIEVKGDGVVGEQPTIADGQSFSYKSAAAIATPIGSMSGFYGFKTHDQDYVRVAIPAFPLHAAPIH